MPFKSYIDFCLRQARDYGRAKGDPRTIPLQIKEAYLLDASSEDTGQGMATGLEAENLHQVSQLEEKYETCLERFPETASPLL